MMSLIKSLLLQKEVDLPRIKKGHSIPHFYKGTEGYRQDLKANFRSRWEANVYRYGLYLKGKHGLIDHIEIEPHLFTSKDGLPQGFQYLPDQLWVYTNGTKHYIEVKGVMDKRTLRAFKFMSKYVPNVKLYVIGQNEYKLIEKHYRRFIPHWEK